MKQKLFLVTRKVIFYSQNLTFFRGLWRGQIDTFAGIGDQTSEKLTQLLQQDGNKFWTHVLQNRGDKLTSNSEAKDGKIYMGEDSIEAGLVDKIGSY